MTALLGLPFAHCQLMVKTQALGKEFDNATDHVKCRVVCGTIYGDMY